MIVSPIGFTSDHIETLHELDIEMMEDAHKAGGYDKLVRARSLNDHPLFIEALAQIVEEHIRGERKPSQNMKLRCPDCKNPECDLVTRFIT